MLQANSAPDKADGMQAFWGDGELYGWFDGSRWRTTDKLKINSFWLLFYNTDQPARQNNDPHPESRKMEVWFDDVVVATEYIGHVQGRPAKGKKRAVPSRSALQTPGLLIAEPSASVFAERFEHGPGKFQGGQAADGGVDGSKAYAFPAQGTSIWNAFSRPVTDATTVRFKLKPLGETGDFQIIIWSKKHQDNCRYRLGRLQPGQWHEVEFRAIEARVGWSMDGPSLEGDVLDNIKLTFEAAAAERMLLDDFEILE